MNVASYTYCIVCIQFDPTVDSNSKNVVETRGKGRKNDSSKFHLKFDHVLSHVLQYSQMNADDSFYLQNFCFSLFLRPLFQTYLSIHYPTSYQKVLLAGSIADGTVWMYHTPTSKCLQVFVGHEAGVTACSFTPDGKFALSASQDGTLRVWAPKTGLSRHVFRFNDTEAAALTCMGINGGVDGQLVICGSENGAAYVAHVGKKKVVATLRHAEVTPTGAGGMDVDGEEEVLTSSVEAVAFAPSAVNTNWCATGGMDGLLKIWDLTTCQCRQICSPKHNTTMEDATAPAEEEKNK